jgi:hypothetical protein
MKNSERIILYLLAANYCIDASNRTKYQILEVIHFLVSAVCIGVAGYYFVRSFKEDVIDKKEI